MVTASLAGILNLLSSYEVIFIYLFAIFLLAFYTLGLGLHDRCIIFAVDGSLQSAITVFVLVMCKRFACIFIFDSERQPGFGWGLFFEFAAC